MYLATCMCTYIYIYLYELPAPPVTVLLRTCLKHREHIADLTGIHPMTLQGSACTVRRHFIRIRRFLFDFSGNLFDATLARTCLKRRHYRIILRWRNLLRSIRLHGCSVSLRCHTCCDKAKLSRHKSRAKVTALTQPNKYSRRPFPPFPFLLFADAALIYAPPSPPSPSPSPSPLHTHTHASFSTPTVAVVVGVVTVNGAVVGVVVLSPSRRRRHRRWPRRYRRRVRSSILSSS